MSDLGTRIMAAGLVEDGMEVESMEEELAKLRAMVSSQKPVCPICKTQLEQVNFRGYYDDFSYWGCSCESFPDGRNAHGDYA